MLHYTVENGLPSNTVYGVYQDKDGIIWVGTDKGVARFNGIEFKTFTTADGLADNECFFFREDLYGRLWIGTFNGQLCYYEKGRFHNARNTPFLKHNFIASTTFDIAVHPDSSLTFFFKDNPGFIEIRGEKLKAFVPQAMLERAALQLISIEKLPGDRYVLMYPQERVIVDSALSIQSVQPHKGFSLRGHFIGSTKRAGYYLAEGGKIYTEDLKPFPFQAEDLVRDVRMIRFIKEKDFEWLGCNKGVYFDRTLLLEGKIVNDVFKDSRGNCWIGTNKDGVYLLSARFDKTGYWPGAYKEEIVFADCRDSILCYAEKDKSLYRIHTGAKGTPAEQLAKPGDYRGSPLDNIFCGWVHRNSFYTFNYTGVYRMDSIRSSKTGKIKLLKNDPKATSYLKQVDEGPDFVCFRGRKQLDFGKPEKVFQVKDSLSMHTLILPGSNKTIYGAAFDKNGRYWFSARENMYYLEGFSMVKKTGFPAIGFREFLFCNNYFAGITHTNELLITNNYLLPQVRLDTIRSNDCVWDKFYRLNDSCWLISTNNYFRILRLDHTSPRPHYTIQLLEHPFVPYLPDYTYVDSTTCFFFKNGSVSTFPISDILQEPEAPGVLFQELITAKGSFFIEDEMRLSYAESKNISILFTPISYAQKNLSYEYSINAAGKPDQWSEIKGNEIDLYKTGYGRFTVKVRARTMSGSYGKTAIFTLHVAKPYWATYWFIGACIPAFIFIVAFVARIGIRQTLRVREKELRFLRSEYKALNALMNPHFIFNSLNSLQSLVNNNENRTASKYIRVFSDLIRQNMRNISQDLIPLSRELDLVENYLRIEQLRFKEHLNYQLTVDDAVETDLIMIPPLLIQPLVENAIKHGIWPKRSETGFVSVLVYEKEEVLYIEITDNGQGFKKESSPETMHESYAMANIEKRTQQLSLIHKIDIHVSVEELTDRGGNVVGVRSLVTVDERGHRNGK